VLARNNGMDKDDIFQLGRLGFIKAMKAFDTTRGIKFSSFAVTAIVREVRCFIRDSASIIRLSRTAHSLLNDIKRLENDLCYLPSTEEIAILLNENEDKIIKVMQIGNSVRYLDESVKYLGAKYDACTFTDMLTDTEVDIENDVVDKIYVSQVLNGIKNRLSDLEIKVLKGQIGGLSQAQIAKTNAISHMRVSRIVKKITSLIDNYKSHIPPV
jgi:RNA polymerase sigma factor (sigma-70 family)